jgi:AcrR family transcriptional regulator
VTRRGTTRDPERTRERILAAALREFAARGFAGARVDAIAAQARANKRMLYHYFGNKQELFRAVLGRKVDERNQLRAAVAAESAADVMVAVYEALCRDTESVRLVAWEALETGSGPLIAEAERRSAAEGLLGLVAREQAEGHLPADLDTGQLLVSLVALVAFPLFVPQVARVVTGLAPTDPAFRAQRRAFLERLMEHLQTRRRPARRGAPRRIL